MDLIERSRFLMKEQTEKNGAPAWLLTEIAVKKGRELAQKHSVDEELVVASLYLAHTVFSRQWKDDIQKNHPVLSKNFVQPFLEEWDVSQDKQKIILNSIEAHHDKISTESKIAEVVKNAECFKFVTVEGSLVWLHEGGRRGYNFNDAVNKVIEKMEQKMKLLTLPDCKEEAEANREKILQLFSFHKAP